MSLWGAVGGLDSVGLHCETLGTLTLDVTMSSQLLSMDEEEEEEL